MSKGNWEARRAFLDLRKLYSIHNNHGERLATTVEATGERRTVALCFSVLRGPLRRPSAAGRPETYGASRIDDCVREAGCWGRGGSWPRGAARRLAVGLREGAGRCAAPLSRDPRRESGEPAAVAVCRLGLCFGRHISTRALKGPWPPPSSLPRTCCPTPWPWRGCSGAAAPSLRGSSCPATP